MRDIQMDRSITIAAACFVFHAVVQLENYLLYVHVDLVSRGWFLARFPFMQLENAAVAALLGLGYAVCARWIGRFYLLLPLACNALVMADQHVYRVFRDHMRLSMMEHSALDVGGMKKLLYSGLGEVNAVFLLNIVLLLITWLVMWRPPGFRLVRRRRPLAMGMAIYVVVSVPVVLWTETHRLDAHPLISLMRDQALYSPVPGEWVLPTPDLFAPRFGTFEEDPDTAGRLSGVRGMIRGRMPHVVFVVLESVGARQLLQGGVPRADVAPFLSELAGRAVVFDSIYGLFPSTTRMHVPLMTGGRTVTWGRVGEELVHPYVGPTLIERVNRLGYVSGMFSAQDLRFESMDVFYAGLPYHRQVFYGDGSDIFRPDQEVHVWGVWEDALLAPALAWVDSALAREAPFFLHINTASTHYPYGSGPAHQGPAGADGDLEKYENALHYTDAALRRLCDALSERGVLGHTLFVITGDHGQAFGDLHADNYAHRNFLYDENVRLFLMVADPRIEGPVISHRVGMVGDMMVSVLSLLNGDAGDVPGRDLFAPDWRLRIAYFHKLTQPEQWGLRDGQWKYIATHDGRNAELYDLSADPDEQRNLAAQYPDRLTVYRDLCARWYVSANYDYIRHLDGFELVGGAGLQVDDPGMPGPKVLAFGYGDVSGQFVSLAQLHPVQPFYIWTRWVAYPKDKVIRYELVAPDGRLHGFDFSVTAGWDITWAWPKLSEPMMPGRWTVRLWDGSALLNEGVFDVQADAPLYQTGIQSIVFGPFSGSEYVDLTLMHPDQPFVIWNMGGSYFLDRPIHYEVISPGGQVHRFDFVVPAGEARTYFNPGFVQDKTEGRWVVRVWDGERLLAENGFEVRADALLVGVDPMDDHP